MSSKEYCMNYVVLTLVAIGILGGIALGIFFKYYTPDDLSLWNNKWISSDREKKDNYLDK